jgi:hypothetical protein
MRGKLSMTTNLAAQVIAPCGSPASIAHQRARTPACQGARGPGYPRPLL